MSDVINHKINKFKKKIEVFAKTPQNPYKTSLQDIKHDLLDSVISQIESIVAEHTNLCLSYKKWRNFGHWTIYPIVSHVDFVEVETPSQIVVNEIEHKRTLKHESDWVYLMECNGLYKIGKSNNVTARAKSIQTGNPHKVNIVRCYKPEQGYAYHIEKNLHNISQSFA